MNDLDELDPRQRELAQALRQALRESEQLDYVATHRLRAARARALEAPKPHRRAWWLASGGVAAAALVVALLVGSPHAGPASFTQVAEAQQAEALDTLTDDTDPDFYEDLDMVRWLDAAPSASPDHA